MRSGSTVVSAMTGVANRAMFIPLGEASQAERKPTAGGGAHCQSLAAGPDIASSKAAASRTVRAIVPFTPSPLISADRGAFDTRPREGLMPNRPQTLAGIRID